jgi:hypothetical protein
MNTKNTIKLARKAFDALQPLDHIDWNNHRERLFAMCKAEEKDHRGFLPSFSESHTADTASVSDAAKLFAVKRIAEYMLGEDFPKGKDFLHIQKSCFYAAGLVDEFKDRIDALWSNAGVNIEDVEKLDYTAIVKVKEAA